MNIDDLVLFVLIALLAVNSYIAFATYRIAQIAAGYKKHDTFAGWSEEDEEDDLYEEAVATVVKARNCSTSLLQRRFRIGYGRAANLVDMLEERGVVGPPDGSKPREVLIKGDIAGQ